MTLTTFPSTPIPGPERPSPCRHLPLNAHGRDWFVGDLHGEAALLQGFLAAVGFDRGRDRLISVEDLIDRGPQCDALLTFLEDGGDWFFAVQGNHDALMCETVLHGFWETQDVWLHNGGKWALALTAGERRRHAEWLAGWPLALDVPLADGRRIGVVHAEVPVGVPGMRWSRP